MPDFDSFDLSSFLLKTWTSAPFSAALKADVLARWPGAADRILRHDRGRRHRPGSSRQHPDKLHTVGKPLPGHDIRLIDDDGNEVPQGEIGEVVGRSPRDDDRLSRPQQATAAAEWYDEDGNRFIRHGDIGRFDEDGFLILMDRKKDLIISGGFNVYPVDIEAVLQQHPGGTRNAP